MIPARLILIGPNHSFPSAVARFGLVATYSGTMPGCQPGLPVSLPHGVQQTQAFRDTDLKAQAAGRPKPAADMGRVA